MQNTLSIRYAFCACARVFCAILEPSIVFKAKVAHAMLDYQIKYSVLSSNDYLIKETVIVFDLEIYYYYI
jgi:hypothetical protein